MDAEVELRQCLTDIESMIDGLHDLANRNGCHTTELKDVNGALLLAPLVIAKANILIALKDMGAI